MGRVTAGRRLTRQGARVSKVCWICGSRTDGGAYCSRECRGSDYAQFRAYVDRMLEAFLFGLPRPVIDWRITGDQRTGGGNGGRGADKVGQGADTGGTRQDTRRRK
jgi:hypothetical protein